MSAGNPCGWLTPLRPREFFGRVWAGDGEWRAKPWVAGIAAPRRLAFRTSTTWLTDEAWLVSDTTSWENGTIVRRDFIATLVAPDRIRFAGSSMPGGCEIQLEADGYAFSPYAIQVTLRLLPVPIVVRCHDVCRLASSGELVDTIDVSFAGVPIGQQVMRLLPE